jgi:hypothetical protein
VDDRGVGLSTGMISTGDEVTSLGTYPVSLVFRCRQATSWEFRQRVIFVDDVPSSETAEPVELDTRSVFPKKLRPSEDESVQRHGLIDVEAEDLA